MSEVNFQSLIKEKPEYAPIFGAIMESLENHPRRGIKIGDFNTDKYMYDPDALYDAVFILLREGLVKSVYRVLDEQGNKVGKDYLNATDVPEVVDTMMGEKLFTKDLRIIPFLTRVSQ